MIVPKIYIELISKMKENFDFFYFLEKSIRPGSLLLLNKYNNSNNFSESYINVDIIISIFEYNNSGCFVFETGTSLERKEALAENSLEALEKDEILGNVDIKEIQHYLRLNGFKTNSTHKGKLETYKTGEEGKLIVHFNPLEPIFNQPEKIKELLKWIKLNIKIENE